MELISYADSSEQEWISMPGDAFSSSTTDFPKPQHAIFPTEQNNFRSFSKMEHEWYLVTTGVPPPQKTSPNQVCLTLKHQQNALKMVRSSK